MEYITLVLAAVAVVLGIVILSKVNKLITMLHTPIVKRVSDTNLKPNRHPVSAQDMAARNERHDNGRGNDRRERGSANAGRQDRSFNRDRSGRNNRRNDRRRDFAVEASAPSAPVEAAPVAPAVQTSVAPAPQEPVSAPEAPRTEGRRPLPPRVQAALPEAPIPAAPAPTPVVEEAPAAAEFEPSKVRYGRRNAIKKIPLEETAEEPKA